MGATRSKAFAVAASDVLAVLDGAIAPLRPSKVTWSATGVTFNTGTSMASWGERVTVDVNGDNPANVTVTSSVRFQVVAWGKNDKNLDLVLNNVDYALKQQRRT